MSSSLPIEHSLRQVEKNFQSPDDRDCIFCPNHELGWHYQDVGHGRPLVLLHGIGMSHSAWQNVIHDLAGERRVLAFDIAGFGLSPPVADDIQPTPANLVSGPRSLADALVQIDAAREISKETEYVDIVGNSLGGFLALEAAKIGKLGCFNVKSIAAISPAGLWKKHYPVRSEMVLQVMRLGNRFLPRLTRILLRRSYTRRLIMAVPMSANVPEEDAVELVKIFAAAPVFGSQTAFKRLRENLKDPFKGGRKIAGEIKVTIAFGDRDWLIPRSARRCDELPEDVIWQNRKGWGHVPMWDDPKGVTRFILEATA